MTNADTLAALAAKLNATPPAANEPIFGQLYSEYMDTADYDGWVPGGIGRVIEQMDADTDPGKVLIGA